MEDSIFNENEPLMSHFDTDVIDFMQWTPEQLSGYLKRTGVPVGNIFVLHKISGDIIGMLTDSDYQRMGIDSVGDCLRIKRAIEILQKKAKIVIRSVTLWEGGEYIIPSILEHALCRYCCKYDRDRYKLTNSSLQLTTKSEAYCCCSLIGPIDGYSATLVRKCSGAQYRIVTIPLVRIVDVDIVSRTPSCFQACCGVKGQDQIRITTNNVTAHSTTGSGKNTQTSTATAADAQAKIYVMYLQEGSGARVVQTIREVLAEVVSSSGSMDSGKQTMKR